MAGQFKLFVLQSQDAWGVHNRLRTVWRQRLISGINQASGRVFGHGGFIIRTTDHFVYQEEEP
jgi:hypothetical protein